MKKLSYKDGEEEELLSKRYTHTHNIHSHLRVTHTSHSNFRDHLSSEVTKLREKVATLESRLACMCGVYSSYRGNACAWL